MASHREAGNMNEGGVGRRRMWWEWRKSGGRKLEMQVPLLAGKREVVRGQQYSSFPSPVLDLVFRKSREGHSTS